MRISFFLLVFLLGFAATGDDDQTRSRDPDSTEFTFLRLVYSGNDWTGASWAIDYPKADRQFIYGLGKLTDFGFVSPQHRALTILDPELFRYPFAYAVEVGQMRLSDQEAGQLREYLLRGGFLVVDDFHGEYEWQNFYSQMKKVFPEFEPVDLPLNHPIFHCYYDIRELFQVPGLQFVYSGRTWEKGGYEAHYRGIQDDTGRLMVMINHNVDLGDAWEWAEVDVYPREYANLAFQLGINYIIYSMTH
jgi:hypothetical protein